MSDTLKKQIEAFEIHAPLHHLTILSGVEAGHLTQYKEAKIIRPQRKTLVKICIALELRFDQMNKIFKEFELEAIEAMDIAYFAEAISDRGIPSGVHPLKPYPLVFEIEIMSIENTSCDVKLVTGYPHRAFDQSAKYEEDTIGQSDVYNSIGEELLKLRKRNFNRIIRKYSTHHLICDKCLKAYVKEKREDPEIHDVFNEMIDTAIDDGNKYKLNIIHECPYFNFHLKEPNKELYEKDKPAVLFAGKPIHKKTGKNAVRTNQLFGFVSTNEELYRHFSQEFNSLSEFIIDESRDPKALKEYISGILNENGISI